jgi:hypothetical protein
VLPQLHLNIFKGKLGLAADAIFTFLCCKNFGWLIIVVHDYSLDNEQSTLLAGKQRTTMIT